MMKMTIQNQYTDVLYGLIMTGLWDEQIEYASDIAELHLSDIYGIRLYQREIYHYLAGKTQREDLIDLIKSYLLKEFPSSKIFISDIAIYEEDSQYGKSYFVRFDITVGERL